MVTSIELGEDLAPFVADLERPLSDVVRELLVIDLYRRGVISSGRGAELLGWSKLAFIQHTGKLGIPYFRYTEDEWEAERQASERLWPTETP